ncbi:MAG TPA: exosortase/archaeosortase family protein [Nitrososphaerales archaeon]|nr:exosortase/archaeosortase family protein [Nitrososphaerales archaeon]
MVASGSAQRGVFAAISAVKRKAAGAPYIAYFAVLVVLAFLADPLSFTRSWNEGRSAMLAVVPLVFLETGRRSLAPLGSGRKALLGWLTLGAAAVYYFAYAQNSVFKAVVSAGTSLGVSPSIVQFSWVWGIDYAVTSIFLISLLLLDRGSRTITPLIYTVGMASFLFIDVLLPENTLGPFGYVVPPVLRLVAGTLDLFIPGAAHSQGNVLTLQNHAGDILNLQVFWPSAGLDGIVIGLLVVFAICVKAGTGWLRGAGYLLLGVLGSFLVNVLRLALLAAYALNNITDPEAFQAFHSVIGELIFIPWIIAFVVLILRRERRLSAYARPLPSSGI